MAINVSQAFHRTSANPVDESMALTKAQMKTVNDNLMPAYYFTVCQDDGYIYLYDKSATATAETGKFKKFEGGGGGGGGTAGSVYTGTLLASGWNSTTKQQTLTFTNYSADYHGVVGLPADATKAQVEAYRDAIIRTVSQSGATVTFECEEIPSINLPVEIYCGGGSGSAEFPSGGTTGQALVKKSNADSDVEWKDIANPTQVSTMPTASAANLGQIVQFVGTTDANYTNGLFYECIENSSVYSWEQKDVQSYPEVDLTNVFASGMPISTADKRPFAYSTEEQIVGSWIDGKPLYQKTFTGLSVVSTTGSSWQNIVSIPNVKDIIDARFLFTGARDTLITTHPKEYGSTNANYLSAWGFSEARTITTVIVQYTKTTD